MRTKDLFATVRTEGGLLPADLLQRIVNRDRGLKALSPECYHLGVGERLNEAISRSWSRLVNTWKGFWETAARLPDNDLGTSATRERWLLILFQELGYGRLPTFKAAEIEDRSYPVSHMWQNSPIHLVGFRVDLDRRQAGVAGAARTSPHSLVQEFLNRSAEHLWGFVSNGLRLRILRDNISLTRQAYVEFDLEAMMEDEVFADFALMWLLCHQSCVEAEKPEECRLEKWTKIAQDQGTRALEHLREGVEKAIKILGAGFLACSANTGLREKLRAGHLSTQDYYRQLLRMVYRLIFLFVAEDRGLLFDPDADTVAKERYLKYYATGRLRRLAERRRGTKHTDLYQGLKLVMAKLGNSEGCPELALPALGSFLWSERAAPELDAAEIANRDLLEAIRALAYMVDDKIFRSIDYKNLGSEELGSVYESLLELHPEINTAAATFELKTAGGNERKTTGSYYTPRSLVQALLDSALDPVLDEAAAKDDPEQAILDLKVCDPACGSGHFLIAAAHRMAKRLAFVRTGDEEPSPEAIQHALRDVISYCIYGVDLNPMAVELCKVSLWMEALEPGKPLSFLEHRIQCGNSLLGVTPALLDAGTPDTAFKPIEGDDKGMVSSSKKQNKEERKVQYNKSFDFDDFIPPWERQGNMAVALHQLDDIDDSDLQGIRRKQEAYEQLVRSDNYYSGKFLADTWCAAFVIKKTKDPGKARPITEDDFRRIEKNPRDVNYEQKLEIQRLAEQYQLFHYHLAFPDVFRVPGNSEKVDNEQTGWSGGFDCVLGNPPWERVKLQEKEWFATRNPDIASAPNAAARRRMIQALQKEDPELYAAFHEDKRKAEGESHIIRDSGRYPLCGRGDVNTYTIFTELKRSLLNQKGRVGCIVPSGIATDDTTKFFFQDLMETQTLVSLYDFENKNLFPQVDSRYKFCLLNMAGYHRPAKGGAEFAFFLHAAEELREEEKRFALSAEDIALLNPNTKTCPIFRSLMDAELTKAIYRRVPVLVDENKRDGNPLKIYYLRLIHYGDHADHLFTYQQANKESYYLIGNVFKKNGELLLYWFSVNWTNPNFV